jgi:hypothetical protein
MADIMIIDAATGLVTERDFTPEEIAQREADQAAAAEAEAAAAAQAAEDAAARAALLERLGMTEDEARLLLGGA